MAYQHGCPKKPKEKLEETGRDAKRARRIVRSTRGLKKGGRQLTREYNPIVTAAEAAEERALHNPQRRGLDLLPSGGLTIVTGRCC